MKPKKIIQWLILWRIALLVCAAIGLAVLPFLDSFPYRDTLLVKYGHPLYYSWANFDGVHYLGIAQDGYWAQFTQAFFPLYPLLVDWLTKLTRSYLLSGLLISHVSLGVAIYFLYELLSMDYSKVVAKRTILFLLLFPTSFYFGAVYTESLFLLLIVASLYAMRKGMQTEAIVLAAFASATRIIGVFLLFALVYEKFVQLGREIRLKDIPKYLPFSGAAGGLLGYMWYLGQNFSDPLYFLNAQPAFGADRSSDKLILLYQVIFRYAKMFATIDWRSLLFYTVNLEFWSAMIFLALLIIAWRQKVRLSYLLFAAPAYLLPTLTGTFSSMPRYVLVLFPAFIVLAKIKNKSWSRLILVVSAILLAINTLLFTRGYWIA